MSPRVSGNRPGSADSREPDRAQSLLAGTPLAEIIRRRIQEEGGLTVADYMTLCLTHPEHGYYTTRQPLGAQGDFITAPEASQIFGELIGAWAAAGWQAMGAPTPFALVELGPGRGLLMQDAFRALRVMPGLLKAVQVHLVETSPLLGKEQEQRLKPLGVPLFWHADIDTLPALPSIIIANEFLDALPVHHCERTPQGWRERRIVLDESGMPRFRADGAPLPAEQVPAWARELPVGTVIEISPEREALAAALARHIADHGGAVLLIDYGHATPGPGETLQALHRHRRVSPFFRPGESDLTAHVDFAAVAAAMTAAGVDVYGPMPQGPFLAALGLEARLEALCRRASARQRIILRRGARRIAADDAMGRLFKVLAAVPAGAPAPAPFTREQKWRDT